MTLILNGSSGISGVDGTIGNPALIGSDPDTGIRFSTGEVSASINGVSGNVALIRETAKVAVGISVDFVGIPSWVRRFTVVFNQLSIDGSEHILIQLGDSGGFENTGYISTSNFLQGGVSSGSLSSTSGIILLAGSTLNVLSGSVVFNNISGNTWVATGMWNYDNQTTITGWTAGNKTLSGTLDRIRVIPTNISASNLFDNGLINIFYE